MITTIQFLHRLGRRARGGDFTKFSMAEQGDLMEAANSALQKLYSLLPVYLREQRQGFLLAAPQTVNVTATPLSQSVGANQLSQFLVGSTISIPGDNAWNEVVDGSTLLNPYLGPIAGTFPATVYGDSIFTTSNPFDRIIGDPEFADRSIYPLFNVNIVRVPTRPYGWWMEQTVGRPQAWWYQAMGNSQGKAPIIVLKFSPVPDMNYAVNIRLSLWPKRLVLSDVSGNTPLPIPDQFIETALIPFGLDALMSTAIWESRQDEQNIVRKAKDGEAFLALIPGQPASPNNPILTPIGY